MIKKLFHILGATIFSAIFSISALLLLYWLVLKIYHINILAPQTYKVMSDYWNNDGILYGKDLALLGILAAFIPLNLIVWRKIFHCKLINLLIIPLNWLANIGSGNYKSQDVNIKNLKVEEKKDLEQFVRERIELENKKRPVTDSHAIRREIIEKIEKEKK